MGKVHYKFEFKDNVDFPTAIKFDTYKADLTKDKKSDELIEGDVGKYNSTVGSPCTQIDASGGESLTIFVESSGRSGSTWKLTVEFTDSTGTRKIAERPIERSIPSNGILIVDEDFKLEK